MSRGGRREGAGRKAGVKIKRDTVTYYSLKKNLTFSMQSVILILLIEILNKSSNNNISKLTNVQ